MDDVRAVHKPAVSTPFSLRHFPFSLAAACILSEMCLVSTGLLGVGCLGARQSFSMSWHSSGNPLMPNFKLSFLRSLRPTGPMWHVSLRPSPPEKCCQGIFGRWGRLTCHSSEEFFPWYEIEDTAYVTFILPYAVTIVCFNQP